MVDKQKAESVVDHLFETYSRMTNTVRYSTHSKIVSENVATHSFFVTYIAMILSDFISDRPVNRERVLRMALIHDIEESLTGDIIYNIKHHNEDFSDAVEKLNVTIIREIYSGNDFYLSIWDEYKECKTVEAKIVEIADRLSSLLYIYSEAKLGNKTVSHMYGKNLDLIMKEDIEDFKEIVSSLSKKMDRE